MNTTPCIKCGFTPELKIVPKLEASNMHPSKMEAEDGRRCLQGWRRAVFGLLAGHPGADLAQAAQDALAAAAGGSIDRADKREGAADLWNAAMATLPGVDLREMSVWRESHLEQAQRMAG